jgi:hypothetical protein
MMKPLKSSNGPADSSKLTPAQGLAMKKANRNRTDPAGRSSMGENARSNPIAKPGQPYSSADLTANNAAVKQPGGALKKKEAFNKSYRNAVRYAVGEPLR